MLLTLFLALVFCAAITLRLISLPNDRSGSK